MENPDLFNTWWPRVLKVSGLVIVFLIVLQRLSLDPYFYPILALMLGLPVASWIEGILRKKNGSGNGNG